MHVKRKSKPFIFLRKTVALFVSFSFILSETVSYAGAASLAQAPMSQEKQSSVIASPPKADEAISIPEELGRIEESWTPSSKFKVLSQKTESPPPLPLKTYDSKLIIYIQDAHDSLEAQENIAKLIHYFVERYGVRTVFEEGYEGPVPTDEYFGFIEDPQIKEKVSYFLMDKLRIGGAEYAHINRCKSATKHGGPAEKCGGDFNLIGADSIKLHLKNIEWYKKNAQYKEETEKDLTALQTEIAKLANQYFPKELKEWMKLKKRYDEKQLSLLDYLKRVMSLRPASPVVDLSRYPNINLLLQAENTQDKVILGQVKQIEPKALFEEIDQLENDFAESLLARHSDPERSEGEESQRSFSAKNLADQDDFSKVRKVIFQYHKALDLLKRLNAIEITPAEYEALKGTLQNLNTQALAEFLVNQTKKSIVLSRKWEENIQKAVSFYETSQARDEAIEKALQAYSVERIADRKKDSLSAIRYPRLPAGGQALNAAILVFGGFHKERIKEIIKQKNLSSLIISPKITEVDTKHRDYYKRLMSVGYHPFEIPLYVREAARAESRFVQVKEGGISLEVAFRSELRGLTETIRRNPSFYRATLLQAEQELPKIIRSGAQAISQELKEDEEKKPVRSEVRSDQEKEPQLIPRFFRRWWKKGVLIGAGLVVVGALTHTFWPTKPVDRPAAVQELTDPAKVKTGKTNIFFLNHISTQDFQKVKPYLEESINQLLKKEKNIHYFIEGEDTAREFALSVLIYQALDPRNPKNLSDIFGDLYVGPLPEEFLEKTVESSLLVELENDFEARRKKGVKEIWRKDLEQTLKILPRLKQIHTRFLELAKKDEKLSKPAERDALNRIQGVFDQYYEQTDRSYEVNNPEVAPFIYRIEIANHFLPNGKPKDFLGEQEEFIRKGPFSNILGKRLFVHRERVSNPRLIQALRQDAAQFDRIFKIDIAMTPKWRTVLPFRSPMSIIFEKDEKEPKERLKRAVEEYHRLGRRYGEIVVTQRDRFLAEHTQRTVKGDMETAIVTRGIAHIGLHRMITEKVEGKSFAWDMLKTQGVDLSKAGLFITGEDTEELQKDSPAIKTRQKVRALMIQGVIGEWLEQALFDYSKEIDEKFKELEKKFPGDVNFKKRVEELDKLFPNSEFSTWRRIVSFVVEERIPAILKEDPERAEAYLLRTNEIYEAYQRVLGTSLKQNEKKLGKEDWLWLAGRSFAAALALEKLGFKPGLFQDDSNDPLNLQKRTWRWIQRAISEGSYQGDPDLFINRFEKEVSDILGRPASLKPRSEVRTKRAFVQARRDTELEILNQSPEPLSRKELTQRLNQKEGFEEVSLTTVTNDTELDPRLRDHPKLQVNRRAEVRSETKTSAISWYLTYIVGGAVPMTGRSDIKPLLVGEILERFLRNSGFTDKEIATGLEILRQVYEEVILESEAPQLKSLAVLSAVQSRIAGEYQKSSLEPESLPSGKIELAFYPPDVARTRLHEDIRAWQSDEEIKTRRYLKQFSPSVKRQLRKHNLPLTLLNQIYSPEEVQELAKGQPFFVYREKGPYGGTALRVIYGDSKMQPIYVYRDLKPESTESSPTEVVLNQRVYKRYEKWDQLQAMILEIERVSNWLKDRKHIEGVSFIIKKLQDAVRLASRFQLSDAILELAEAKRKAEKIGPKIKLRVAGEVQTSPLDEAIDWFIKEISALSRAEVRTDLEGRIQELISNLRDPNVDALSASESLVQIGEAAVPALAKALEDRALYVRERAVATLFEIGAGAKAAIPQLAKALEDSGDWVNYGNEGGNVRWYALLTLERIGELAFPQLVEALRNFKVDVPHWAALVLKRMGNAGNKAAVLALANALKDGKANVRRVAANALVDIHPQAKVAIIHQLGEALKDEDTGVKQHIALSLALMGPQISPEEAKTIVPQLAGLLKDPYDQVRHYSIAALERMGPMAKAAASQLEEVLKDKNSDPYMLEHAATALAAMGLNAKTRQLKGTYESVHDLLEALNDSDVNVRLDAAQAVGKIDPAAVPSLVQALQDPEVNVRWHAAWVLTKIGPAAKEAVPALAKALNDSDAHVRSNAALALGEIGPAAKETVPALVQALKDSSDNVRRRVIEALEKIDPEALTRAEGGELKGPSASATEPGGKSLGDDESAEVRTPQAGGEGKIEPLTPASSQMIRDQAFEVMKESYKPFEEKLLGQLSQDDPATEIFSRSSFERSLADDQFGWSKVYLHDGKVVGFVIGEPSQSFGLGSTERDERIAMINEIGVKEEFRGRGIMREVIHAFAEAVAATSEWPVRYIIVAAAKDNVEATARYEHYGFKKYDEVTLDEVEGHKVILEGVLYEVELQKLIEATKPRAEVRQEFWASELGWEKQYMGYAELGLQAQSPEAEPLIAQRIREALIHQYPQAIQAWEWHVGQKSLTYHVLVDPNIPNVDKEREQFKKRLERALKESSEEGQEAFLKQFTDKTPLVVARITSARHAFADDLANGFIGIRREAFEDAGTLLREWLRRLNRVKSIQITGATDLEHEPVTYHNELPEVLSRRIEILPVEQIRDLFLDIAESHELRHELLIHEGPAIRQWHDFNQVHSREEVLAALEQFDREQILTDLMRTVDSRQFDADLEGLETGLSSIPADAEEYQRTEEAIKKFLTLPHPFDEPENYQIVLSILKSLYVGKITEQEAKRRFWHLIAESDGARYRLPEDWIRAVLPLTLWNPNREYYENNLADLRAIEKADDIFAEDYLDIETILRLARDRVHAEYVRALNKVGELPTLSQRLNRLLESKLKPELAKIGFDPAFTETLFRLSAPAWKGKLTNKKLFQSASDSVRYAVEEYRHKLTHPSPMSIHFPNEPENLLAYLGYLNDSDPKVREMVSSTINSLIGGIAIEYLEKKSRQPVGLEILYWGFLETSWRLLLKPKENFEGSISYDQLVGWAQVAFHAMERLQFEGIEDPSRFNAARKRVSEVTATMVPLAAMEYQLQPERFFIILRHGDHIKHLVEYLTHGTDYDLPASERPEAIAKVLDTLEEHFENEPPAIKAFYADFAKQLEEKVAGLEPSLSPDLSTRITKVRERFTKRSEVRTSADTNSRAEMLEVKRQDAEKQRSRETEKAEMRRDARETASRFQEKYAVVVDMNVFDALSEEQKIEFKKQIHARSEVRFVFNVTGDRRLDLALQELMDFGDRYKNIEIRIDPTSFDFQGRKVINVSKEGIQSHYADFLERRLGQSKDLYRVRYWASDREAGLLTAALLLLESKPEDFLRQGRYFSEVPVGLKADIEHFLLTYVYVGRSA